MMKKVYLLLVLLIYLITMAPRLSASASTLELPKTGQTLCYDMGGNVIPCAGTGQDGETKLGSAWPSPRFNDNLDGTVTDNLTGLIWLGDAGCSDIQSSDGSDWSTAITAAKNLHSGQCGLRDGSLAGDWRLPNASELASLVDLSEEYPSLPAGCPFVHTANNYWTSTTYPLYSANAEGISMGNGCIRADEKINRKLAWPVKGTTTKIAVTGQKSCWDMNGAAIPCSGTGEDGDKQAGVPWPVPRFVDNGNGTVVDLLTHLVWLQNANCFGNVASQDVALADAKTLANNVCGLTDGSSAGDWRLPNINEMRSLANYEETNGATWLNGQGFTNAQYCFYWTSDSYVSGVDQNWLPSGADQSLGDKWLANTNGSAWLSSWVTAAESCKYALFVRGPFDAVCGSSNGETFSSAPVTDLCSAGSTPSKVTGTGPWTWTCSAPQASSIKVDCSANYLAPVPPTVNVISPSNGAIYTAPATVTITAAATAGTGASVKRVDFSNGTTLLGTSTSTPYSFTWINVTAGTYSLAATVTDTAGATATSSAVSITVNPAPAPPTVTITAPSNGSTYTSPATVTITATATAGSGASVKQVDFYSGTTLLGTSAKGPYKYVWRTGAVGSYSLTARVTNTLGATATSTPVAITIKKKK